MISTVCHILRGKIKLPSQANDAFLRDSANFRLSACCVHRERGRSAAAFPDRPIRIVGDRQSVNLLFPEFLALRREAPRGARFVGAYNAASISATQAATVRPAVSIVRRSRSHE
jgi:hypothetical protein